MTKFQKDCTSHEVIKRTFQETINRYIQNNFEVIYKDGSKTEDSYGAAVITENNHLKYRCHKYSSVYSTELFAILQALKNRITDKTIICTDSLCKLSQINMLKTH